MHENCRCGGDELRQAHADALRGRLHLHEGRRRHRAGVSNEAGGFQPRTLAQAYRLRQAGEAIRPILTILLEPLGSAISRIVLEQQSERAEATGVGSPSSCERGVDVRHASSNERETNSICHDVMVARIPKEMVGRRLEERKSEKRTLSDVDRLCQISLHPSVGRRLRIGRGADIDVRHRPIGRRADDLAGAVGGGHKADTERLGLIDNLPQRGFEQRRVDRPADVQILAKIVCRARPIECLSEPNSKLGIRQGKRTILW